jgi:hypothetical protein
MLRPLPVVPGVRFVRVKGFPAYAVGDDGTVWSCWKRHGNGTRGCRFTLGTVWRKLKPGYGQGGHEWVILSDGVKPYKRYVHHLVLLAFVGPRPKGMVCRHTPDRTPTNNRSTNLKWGTRKENHDDMVKDGTRMDSRGECNGQAKLTEKDVLLMRRTRAEKGTRYCDLAIMFNISWGQVKRIMQGRSWKHI